jgi:long-chain fatty acid transport protein
MIFKNLRYLLSIFILIISGTGIALASQLHQEDGIMPNQSAEYVRTQSRNASIDADAAFYNPAGTAFMKKNGLYIMFSSQTLYAKKESSFRLWGIQPQGGAPRATTESGNPYFYTTNNKYLVPKRYPAEIIAPVLPDFDVIYKGPNWAAFLYVAVTQAAPGLTFKNGTPDLDRAILTLNEAYATTLAQRLTSVIRKNYAKRTEQYLSGTIGGSYAFLDWLSAALSFRYIHMTGNQKVSQVPLDVTYSAALPNIKYPMLIDTDVRGNGYGLIAGLDFKPLESLNIGIRAEYYLPMILKKNTKKFIAHPTVVQSGQLNLFADSIWPLIINDRLADAVSTVGNVLNFADMDPRSWNNIGDKLRVTYPPSLSIGLSYNIVKEFRIESSVDLTFPNARKIDGREHNFKDVGYRLGQAFEWTIIPMVIVSAGYSYYDPGVKPEKRNENDQLLTSHTVGAGTTIKALDWLDITLGAFYSFYMPETTRNVDYVHSTLDIGIPITTTNGAGWDKKFWETRWSVALGLTARFFGDNAPGGTKTAK